MTSPLPDSVLDQVHDLTLACLSGEAGPEAITRLDTLVCSSEAACRVYVQTVFDGFSLRRWIAGDRQFTDPCESDDTGAALLPPLAMADAGVTAAIPHTFLSTTLHGALGCFPEGMPLAYLLATVIFGVGLLIGWLIPVSSPEQVARQSAPLTSPLSSLPSVVGRITGTVDCKWEKKGLGIRDWGLEEGSGFRVQGTGTENRQSSTFQSLIPNPQSLVSLGDKFALASGLMEITYDTGARVILQGPVTYEVEANGGYLAVGKLTGKLEKNNDECRMMNDELRTQLSDIHHSSFIIHPFVVHTPAAIVTDLGTEFGVEVTEDGATESRVFAGAIKIVPVSNQHASTKEQIVRAGSAVRVDGRGRLVAVMEPRERQFVRALPSPTATASAAAEAYADLVLSMRPFAYYRMERPKDPKKPNLVFDSAPGGHHGTLHLANQYGGDPWWEGRFGESIFLRGNDVGGDYIEVPNYPGTNTDQLSVSVWVHPMRVHAFDMIVCDVPIADTDGGYQFLLGVDSRLCLLGASVQRDKKDLWLAEEDKGADNPLLHYRWRHVALVVDGTAVHLYRDGMEVSKLSCRGVLKNPSHSFFIGGRCLVRSGRPMPMNLWHGRIDELAIFHHALSGEQVRQLFVGSRKETEIDKSSTTLATP